MYKNIIFDCDGVILHSNKVKTKGFYYAAKSFGHEKASKIEKFHKSNGGISRYSKFRYFITNILEVPFSEKIYKNLLQKYSNYVSRELFKCNLAVNIRKIRNDFPSTNWSIVSGGDQEEIKEIFIKRGIDTLFDGGIYGSPRNKFEIFEFLLSQGFNKKDSIYLGDSHYDFEVASHFKIDFRYISGWSEFENLKINALENNIIVHNDVQSFFASIK